VESSPAQALQLPALGLDLLKDDGLAAEAEDHRQRQLARGPRIEVAVIRQAILRLLLTLVRRKVAIRSGSTRMCLREMSRSVRGR